MQAYQLNRYGKKSTLQLADVAMPTVTADDVLIEVHSAGVNVLDLLIKNGDFKLFLPYKTPFTLGHDVAGVITQVGANVTAFKVGDEVYARPSDHHIGTFAQYIAVATKDVALKPINLNMTQAASIPLVGLTVWQALVEVAKVQKGQKVFIQAGTGGVGTFAIQLSKHLGATVATTVSAGNIDLVKRLGADVVIDYKTEDFDEKLHDYDVVLNSTKDPEALDKSLCVLKSGGQLISLVGPPTAEFSEKLSLPWYLRWVTQLLSAGIKRKAKKRGINFTFLFMRADGKQLKQITQLIESGSITPVVDKVFSFSQTNEALRYVETGRAKGKVVVDVSRS